MEITSSDLKREFLKLLKEDEEFRYAVAGLLGLREILEELRRLREDLNRFMAEQEKRWEENNRRWEENNRRWEENAKRWEENNKRWEENNKRWEENNKRWEENARRWEENNRKWEEAYKRFEAIENELKKLREDFNRFVIEEEKRWEENNRRLSRIELELGALTESVYSKYVLEEVITEARARGEIIEFWKRNAVYDNVEIDLIISTNRSVYVVEVKVKPSIEDVGVLLVKSDIAKKHFEKPIIPVLAGALIGREIESYAESKGVKIYKY